MIKAVDAIRIARGLIGTPYSELDCINLIKKVIRTAPGGVKDYTTAGTNALWDSYSSAAKYKDLTQRQTGISAATAGMLAFKADGEDVHHVGLVTDAGTVIHSSSAQGGRGVVETPLTAREGWTHLAVHRHIGMRKNGRAPGEGHAEGDHMVVVLSDPGSSLNVRVSPGGAVIAQIADGTEVNALSTGGEWIKIRLNDGREGYVSAAYVRRAAKKSVFLQIVDEAGNVFYPQGGFTVFPAQGD